MVERNDEVTSMSNLRKIFLDCGGRDHQRLSLKELAGLLSRICRLSEVEIETWYEPETANQHSLSRWRIEQERIEQEGRRWRLVQGQMVEDQMLQDGTEWEPHNSNDIYEGEEGEDVRVEREGSSDPNEGQAQSSASFSGKGLRGEGWRRAPSLIQTKSRPHSINEEAGMELKWRQETERNRAKAAKQLGLLIEDVSFTISKKCDAASFVKRNQGREDAVPLMNERLEILSSILETLSQVGYSDASVISWMLSSSEAVIAWLHKSGSVSEAQRLHAISNTTRMLHSLHSMSVSPRPSWLIAVEALTLPALGKTHDHVPEGYDGMICMLCASLGALRHRPSQLWLRALSDASGQCIARGDLSPGQLASLVKGLVDLGCRVPQTISLKWLRALEASTSDLLRGNSCSAEEIVCLLDSIASLTSPSSSSLQSLTSLLDVVMLQEDGGDEFEDDDYFDDPNPEPSDQIASGPTPYTPSSEWLEAFYSAVQQCTFSVPQQIALVSGLNSLRCRPNGQWLNEMLVKSRKRLSGADAQEMADLIGSLTSLRFKASEGWLQFWLSEAFHKLPFASPAQCCLMLRCLARLNHRPPRLWMEELSCQLQGRLHQFNASQLSDLAVAVVQLGSKPTEPFLREFERVCDGSMIEKCTGAELTGLAWALAQMSWKPQVSWTYSLVLSAYKRLDGFNSQQLGVLFEALPKISPQLNSLDELVQIVATENQKRG